MLENDIDDQINNEGGNYGLKIAIYSLRLYTILYVVSSASVLAYCTEAP